MAGNFTFFTNDSGSAAGPVDYVKDAFLDISLPATNNTSLTDSASTNPLSEYFANNDSPRFGVKTLYIKDLMLIEDRSKWVSNKPTYKVIFTEDFPPVSAYVFGNPSITRKSSIISPDLSTVSTIVLQNIGDGMGVSGIVRRLSWLVQDDTSATATAQLATDGSNTTTVDFSGLASDSDATNVTKFSSFAHEASNATQDLHDRRISALQVNTLKLVGIMVYFENTGANVEMAPGTTYVDKSKIITTTGASLAVSSYGSSLGGVSAYYKSSSSGYQVAAISASPIISIAQGSSGTNLLTVTTGTGASFLTGYGFVVPQGTSFFVGSVSSVSTDTLTVSPTLPFGISGSMYTAWKAGSTLAIGATLYKMNLQYDLSKFLANSVSTDPVLDPSGRFAVYSSNLGMTYMAIGASGGGAIPVLFFKGASGYLQLEGRFSAAEVEFAGSGTLAATFSINGTPAWSINAGQTGSIKRTLVTDAGAGWNSILMQAGASLQSSVGIAKINLYDKYHQGVTFGVLSQLQTMGAYAERSAINATLAMLGNYRRVFADQMYLKGSWVRGSTLSAAGGIYYSGASTNSVLQVQYYGKNFSVIGTAGTSGVLSIDGASTSVSFNSVKVVGSEGFHTVQFTHQAGTCIIQAFDFSRSQRELHNTQNVRPSLMPGSPLLSQQSGFVSSEVMVSGSSSYGASFLTTVRFLTLMTIEGSAISYFDDTNSGAAFVINEDGLYGMNYSFNFTGAGAGGISINVPAAAGSTSILLLPLANVLGTMETRTANSTGNVSAQITCRKGDVLRPQTDTTSLGAGAVQLFRIVQLRKA